MRIDLEVYGEGYWAVRVDGQTRFANDRGARFKDFFEVLCLLGLDAHLTFFNAGEPEYRWPEGLFQEEAVPDATAE